VETEKASDDKTEEAGKEPSGYDEELKFGVHVFSCQGCDKNTVRSSNDKSRRNRCIKKHIQKVFVIIKADAVSNPRTMMIHLENALVTL
tara:strand:+ start:179 stop:445 length:267 start_codon:yes stop_codon:yes gene_type:complete